MCVAGILWRNDQVEHQAGIIFQRQELGKRLFQTNAVASRLWIPKLSVTFIVILVCLDVVVHWYLVLSTLTCPRNHKWCMWNSKMVIAYIYVSSSVSFAARYPAISAGWMRSDHRWDPLPELLASFGNGWGGSRGCIKGIQIIGFQTGVACRHPRRRGMYGPQQCPIRQSHGSVPVVALI